jgi:hypothetical protein
MKKPQDHSVSNHLVRIVLIAIIATFAARGSIAQYQPSSKALQGQINQLPVSLEVVRIGPDGASGSVWRCVDLYECFSKIIKKESYGLPDDLNSITVRIGNYIVWRRYH